jgi:hypothetical protein
LPKIKPIQGMVALTQKIRLVYLRQQRGPCEMSRDIGPLQFSHARARLYRGRALVRLQKDIAEF